MKKIRGFTLIELLIVISILGILATLISVNFVNSLKRGRDTKRKGDLHSIQNMMEQCYSLNTYSYPILSLGDVDSTPVTCGTTTLNISNTDDPSIGMGKYRVISSTVDSYQICSPLVNGPNRLEIETCTGAETNPACCVQNQQ